MADVKRNVDFLYELGTLRFIPRIWRQFLNKNFANLAEHHFRVMWIAMIIAKEEGADVSKVALMALAHDIAESRTGDVHYLSRMYTTRDEDRAIKDMLVGTSLEEEFVALFHEYEERQTLEAKIVKDADNLDIDLELQEQYVNGVAVKDNFQHQRERVSEMLFTETAKKLFAQIQNSNPHDWHVYGNNRFTNGDWKR